MKNRTKERGTPSLEELKEELEREDHRDRYAQTLGSTVNMVTVTAAIVVLLAFLLFPVFRIYGNSMSPTVNEGEIVISRKGSSFKYGDVIVLSYNNKLLVKRVIAGPAQWVDIDSEGNVFVDEVPLYEPYLIEKAFGDCNISLPYQVPEGRYFVMGDNRATSQDSRSTLVGCIPEEQIVGRAVFRLWPFESAGFISHNR